MSDPPSPAPPELFIIGGRTRQIQNDAGEYENQYPLFVSYRELASRDPWDDLDPRNLPDIYKQRVRFGAAVYNHQGANENGDRCIDPKIFICGGQLKSKAATNRFDVFDCRRKTFQNLGDMPERRKHCAAAVLGDYLYVAGGTIDNHPTNTVLRYRIAENPEDPTLLSGDWDSVLTGFSDDERERLYALNVSTRPMNKNRSDFCLLPKNDRLYAIDGYKEKTIEEYNPATNTWRLMDDMKSVQKFASAVEHEGRFYIHGSKPSEPGRSPKTCTFEAYPAVAPDEQTLLMRQLPVSKGASLLKVNNSLWLIGGACYNIEKIPKDKIFEFDLTRADKRWVELGGNAYKLSFPRVHHKAFLISYE